MTLPVVTRAQLEPLLEKLLGADGGAADEAPVVFVRADPASVPAAVSVGGRPVELLATSSPLEIRARMAEARDLPLVVLTGCDNEALGTDLLARSVKRRLHGVDRWVNVCGLFGAEKPSRALAHHSDLADALLEAKPVSGYPKLATKVLDLDTALDNLVRWHLELEVLSVPAVLAWAETPRAARVLQPAGPVTEAVLDLLTDHVAGQLNDGVRFAFAAARAGRGEDLMALALAATVVHGQRGDEATADQIRASVQLDLSLAAPGAAGPELPAAVYRLAGEAAVARALTVGEDRSRVARWINGADNLISQWKLTDQAWYSDVLISGFTGRLARAATAIASWRRALADNVSPTTGAPTGTGAGLGGVGGTVGPASATEAEALAMAAVADVAAHRQAGLEPDRVDRMEMAARLVRRRSARLAQPGTLTEALVGYTIEGAWLDRARFSVSRRDTVPDVAALCDELTAEFDQERRDQGASLATVVAGAAHDLPDTLTGIEAVLDTVVAPLATQVPVLLVVLDGMGWPTFTEVLERLEEQGWTSVADPAGVVTRPVVAVLPTVTEVSRTSLLAGRLRKGDNASEGRAFIAHPALVAAGRKDKAPALFHKADLREGGIDTTPAKVVGPIQDDKQRIVGLVINNIDERLKDVAAPLHGWGLSELQPLPLLLDAARAAGRAVIVTADHGHVLHRDSEQRKAGGGGERWRTVASGPAGDGEIVVSGVRVVVDDKSSDKTTATAADKPAGGGEAILPWDEQIRYAASRNGYHGGLTLAELAVPLAVLTADTIDGWSPRAVTPPRWWHPTPVALTAEVQPGAPADPGTGSKATSASARRDKPAADPPTLFDAGLPPVETTPATPPRPSRSATSRIAAADPVARILASPQIEAQLPGLRLDPAVVAAYLTELDRAGGTRMSEARVADAIGYNRSRISFLTSTIQRLVNLDGYAVIEAVNGEIRFDRSLLETQLGLA